MAFSALMPKGDLSSSAPLTPAQRRYWVAPPVSQTQLHAQTVARRLLQHEVEKRKLGFVPFIGLVTKRMRAWPVVVIRDRLDVFRAAFARSPHAHDFDSGLRRLAQSLAHHSPIVIAIHHGHVRADKAKRLSVEHEPGAVGLHESGTSGPGTIFDAAPARQRKQNRRARNQRARGEKKLSLTHEG